MYLGLGNRAFVAVGLLALGASSVRAADNPATSGEQAGRDTLLESLEAIEQMSLADFLAQSTSVAAATPLSQRSSPGIITVVTRQEILDSGARDLIDVLRLVPGFDFGNDVQGSIGVGFRGMWGHEGKVLLLLDGHELNEGLYLTTQFGNHYPVDQIERIEIIRGPGSAVYGGYAELAVLNVVTRHGEQIDGVDASLTYGQMAGGYARRNLSLSAGQRFEQLDGLTVSASGFIGQSRRSDLDYRDLEGTALSMRSTSGADPAYLNLNASWRGAEVSFVYDDYRISDRTGFTTAFSNTAQVDYSSYLLNARYQLELPNGFTLTPRLRFKHQQPWRVLSHDEEIRESAYYDKTFQRFEGGLLLNWQGFDGLSALAGVETYLDQAHVDGDPVGLNNLFDGQRDVSYDNLAAFAQGVWLNPIVNLTLGARFENHSAFGSSFVPRAGLTKEFGRMHLKLLYSNAFKAPGIENITLNDAVRPERTRAVEVEAGYLFSDDLFASLNAFHTLIDGPIVYGFDSASGGETYLNFATTGADGVEAVIKYRHARGFANLSYSFYTSVKNEVDAYQVPGHDAAMLGFPQHKLTASGTWRLLPTVSLAPSAIFMSERWAYARLDGAGEPQLSRLAPVFLADLFVTWRPETFAGLSLQAGVHDLFDQQYAFAQPYNSGHAPMPGASREFGVRLAVDH